MANLNINGNPYSTTWDQLSEQLAEKARWLDRSRMAGTITPDGQIAALHEKKEELLAELKGAYESGKISERQYRGDSKRLDLSRPGGEVGEILRVTDIYSAALKKVGALANFTVKDDFLFSTDIFHNVTVTAQSADNKMVHMRFGTHGGYELRDRVPNAMGFPFVGSKWVEGDLVFGNKIYSFVDPYTDNFKVDLGPDGKPAALRFRGEVLVKSIKPQVLPTGKGKWSEGLSATQAEGRAILEFSLPISSHGGDKPAKEGMLGMGFIETNFALSGNKGDISIAELDAAGKPGVAQKISLATLTGQVEQGQMVNTPKDIPAVYRFVQGQPIEFAKLVESLVTSSPKDLLPLFPKERRQNELGWQSSRPWLEGWIATGGQFKPVGWTSELTAKQLAAELHGDLMQRAIDDPDLKRQVASFIAEHFSEVSLGDRLFTSTQWAAKFLKNGLLAKIGGRFLDGFMDAAGRVHLTRTSPDPTYENYEKKPLEKLRENEDFIEPLVALNVNSVPMVRQGSSGKEHVHALERRTVLLFDKEAGQFLIGFQEVFHDK
jgi:hypothetical protein